MSPGAACDPTGRCRWITTHSYWLSKFPALNLTPLNQARGCKSPSLWRGARLKSRFRVTLRLTLVYGKWAARVLKIGKADSITSFYFVRFKNKIFSSDLVEFK